MIAQCIHDITMSYGLAGSLFLAGLVGGATHCAGMCGPFVLAQVEGGPGIRKLGSALLLPYHLGRMTTYVVLAVLVNSLVNLAFVFSGLKALIAAPMLLLAGVIFLVSAFPALSVLFPWAVYIRVYAPYKFLARFVSKWIDNPGIFRRYGLGVLLGFMPCGLVVSALLASATAPDIFQAAAAMSAFTAGTMPALILIGFGGHALRQKYPGAAAYVRQAAMAVSSLWLFILAGTMIL